MIRFVPYHTIPYISVIDFSVFIEIMNPTRSDLIEIVTVRVRVRVPIANS